MAAYRHIHIDYWQDSFVLDLTPEEQTLILGNKKVKGGVVVNSNDQAPSGAFGDDTVKAANDLGYICYKWDVDTIDWMDKDNPDKIIQRIQKKDIKDGSIVLMHPTKATSICLDEIISIIRTRGYVPGKLSDVFSNE